MLLPSRRMLDGVKTSGTAQGALSPAIWVLQRGQLDEFCICDCRRRCHGTDTVGLGVVQERQMLSFEHVRNS